MKTQLLQDQNVSKEVEIVFHLLDECTVQKNKYISISGTEKRRRKIINYIVNIFLDTKVTHHKHGRFAEESERPQT